VGHGADNSAGSALFHIFAVLAEVGLPEAWREDGAGGAARKIARLMRDLDDARRRASSEFVQASTGGVSERDACEVMFGVEVAERLFPK
jgi:hypothetical protein